MIPLKLRAIPFVALLFPLDCFVAILILLSDLLTLPLRLFRHAPQPLPPPDLSSVTIQILNWDGKHLLEECLPSVLEAVRHYSKTHGGRHEVLIVDNGSRDGSVEFLQTHFPEVRVLRLDRNYGFGGGNNRGFQHVQSDMVVLLNNDMSVDRDFLEPLLAVFTDRTIFAAASQIFFADQARRREETGKTRGRFHRGFFLFWHDDIQGDEEAAIPVFWAGGGSCAIDRRKLAALGTFDALYHPFYVEDVDVSYQAWKRGWRSVLAPRSQVVHKHRGTSRPKFGDDFIDQIVRRNQFLFVWKNLTDMGLMLRHFIALPRIHGRAIVEKGARFELYSYLRAFVRLPFAIRRRASNLAAACVSDSRVLKLSQ